MAIKIFNEVRQANRTINTKLCELRELESLATCVNAVVVSEKVQSSHENNSNKIIDKIIDMQIEINAEIDILIDLKKEARQLIEKLDNQLYKNILINRYVNCYTFEKCAEVMEYDLRYIYKLHKRALKDSVGLCYYIK